MNTTPNQENPKLNLRLAATSKDTRSIIETYLIEEVKKLKKKFSESNFEFGFEELPDMFIIQVNDLTTFHDKDFKLAQFDLLREFRKQFKGETLLFITPTHGLPIENSIFKI